PSGASVAGPSVGVGVPGIRAPGMACWANATAVAAAPARRTDSASTLDLFVTARLMKVSAGFSSTSSVELVQVGLERRAVTDLSVAALAFDVPGEIVPERPGVIAEIGVDHV